jgi:hypothetical protein
MEPPHATKLGLVLVGFALNKEELEKGEGDWEGRGVTNTIPFPFPSLFTSLPYLLSLSSIPSLLLSLPFSFPFPFP